MLRKRTEHREFEYNAFIALIDVVFLLLLYFIMTFRAITEESLLHFSPAGSNKAAVAKKAVADLVMVEVMDGETCLLNGRTIASGELSGWLNEIAETNPDTGIILLCRDHVKQHTLVEILDLCRKSKLKRVSLATK